ncbi:PAS domain-containing sensor histidine kinase [Bacillus mesophilum]|uniref:histidine kinase n=1 Tax=Bacillus mesophilum TaxID=1071718 RepID=A0A7V7UT98_9BACI|nr:PAS domain-containing sensor histidine kinase [Bacillus mesophilum]KAB2330334.1 PAS domain S-box protein [Bacillus mesophilum]
MNLVEIDAFEILDRITDGFFALDMNWNFTYVNDNATRLLFRSRDNLVGKNIWIEFPEAVDLIFYKQYQKAVNEQVFVHFESYFPPLHAWFSVRAYPSDNGLSVYFQDITAEKKTASQNEQHYKSLFEHNPNAVFSFDLEGNYLSVNTAMVKMLGYSEQELLLKTFIPLVAEEDLDKTMDYYKRAANGTTQNYEIKCLHKNGDIVYLSVTNMPIIVDQEVIGVYGIAKNITDRKLTEQKLLKSEKLSAVGQLSASIAHEIRNPLTALKGFLQLMKASEGRIKDSYLEVMSSEMERIELITGELLLLAKPQAHQFKLENIEEIIQNVTTLLGSQALMHNVEIKIVNDETIPPVRCIANQLKQVFINLIKNALESMQYGGKVLINVQVKDDQTLFISIADEGEGIPEDLLRNIGLPFYTTKQKGTGLGMMTSLRIIEAHNGTMDITSTVGKGTVVSISLPLVSCDQVIELTECMN